MKLEDIEKTYQDIAEKLPPGTVVWFGITGGVSGGWTSNPDMEKEIRAAVQKVFMLGGGIVSGGALGVDYIATDEAMKLDPAAARIKIILPSTLDKYFEHYRKLGREQTVSSLQAEDLIKQLNYIRFANSNAVVENPNFDVINEKAYFERNTQVIKASNVVLAFISDQDVGIPDTIQKAKEEEKPLLLENLDNKN